MAAVGCTLELSWLFQKRNGNDISSCLGLAAKAGKGKTPGNAPERIAKHPRYRLDGATELSTPIGLTGSKRWVL